VLLTAAVALLLTALARPQYGTLERPMRRRGVEVLVAIDTSLSMLAPDIPPTRLARARAMLRDLLQRLSADSVGVLAFAGIPIVQCPLTTDHDMALNLLDTIDTESVPVQGTAIGATIRKAIETFREPGTGHKALVLLTDGEDHDSKPLEAAQEAAKAGIVIYAIGIGSTAGTFIPLPEGGLKENEGTKVNSRLDFETLRQIALATGGAAIVANPTGDKEVAEVTRRIEALAKSDLGESAVTVHLDRFQIPLGVVLALLALEMLLGERRRRAQSVAGRFD
jgi:Ca-activated chloride channel family protein